MRRELIGGGRGSRCRIDGVLDFQGRNIFGLLNRDAKNVNEGEVGRQNLFC